MNTQSLSEAHSALASVACRNQAKVSQVSRKESEIKCFTEWLEIPIIQSEGYKC